MLDTGRTWKTDLGQMTDRRNVIAPGARVTNVERSVPKLYVERAGFGLRPSPSHVSNLAHVSIWLTLRNSGSRPEIQEMY